MLVANECIEETKKGKCGKLPILRFVLIWLITQVILTVILSISAMFLAIPQGIENLEQNMQAILQSNEFNCFAQFLTIIELMIPILYCVFIEKRSLRSMGIVKEKIIRNYLIGYGLGALLLTLSLGFCLLMGAATMETVADIPWVMVLLFFLAFLIQGAAEEVVCRGYFFQSLTSKYPITTAIFISSFAFSIMHIFNQGFTILPCINIAIFGVLMAVIFLKTDNLWMVCALHSAWNFFQGCVFGIRVSGFDKMSSIFAVESKSTMALVNGGNFGLEGGIAVTIVLVCALVIVSFLKNKKEKQEKPQEKIEETVEE